MVGMRVVVVACRDNGDVDLDDLRAKVAEHADALAALMITYPSTHGVYEHDIADICAAVHDAGGQVYVDGANLNALVGLARPGKFGGDVSHLNLHKTFCIPHGGGGPGVGPVAVRAHLAAVPARPPAGRRAAARARGVGGAVRVGVDPADHLGLHPDDGRDGLRAASLTAIASANYIARRLDEYYPVLYTGENGMVAHECILDLRGDHQGHRRHRRRCGKAVGGLRFPRPDDELPGGGHADGRADREREPGRGGRVLRGDDRDPRPRSTRSARAQWPADDNPLRNAPHTAECLLVDEVGSPVHPRAGRLPAGQGLPARRCGRRCAASTAPTATATWCARARRWRRSPELMEPDAARLASSSWRDGGRLVSTTRPGRVFVRSVAPGRGPDRACCCTDFRPVPTISAA